jgi:hypothetical protein
VDAHHNGHHFLFIPKRSRNTNDCWRVLTLSGMDVRPPRLRLLVMPGSL